MAETGQYEPVAAPWVWRADDIAARDRKRHMLRLWLTMPDWRAWPDEMNRHNGGPKSGGAQQGEQA